MVRAVRAQQRSFGASMKPRHNAQTPSSGVQLKLVMLYDICRKVAEPSRAMQEGLALRTGTVNG
jgi:hypothetical protein